MDNIVIRDIPIKFDLTEVTDLGHIRKDSALYEEFEEALPIAQELLSARAVLREFDVEEIKGATATIGCVDFNSKTVADALQGQKTVWLGIITAGDTISATDEIDFELVSYYYETMALKLSSDYIMQYLEQEQGLTNVTFLEPGTSGDFAIEENKTIYDLLETVEEEIGITIKSSHFMTPTITLTGIFYSAS